MEIGTICHTPFEPSGKVKAMSFSEDQLYGEVAFVEFIEDHPHGYRKGETGAYGVKELIPVNLFYVDCINACRADPRKVETWLDGGYVACPECDSHDGVIYDLREDLKQGA